MFPTLKRNDDDDDDDDDDDIVAWDRPIFMQVTGWLTQKLLIEIHPTYFEEITELRNNNLNNLVYKNLNVPKGNNP
jgi:hypothetical protein